MARFASVLFVALVACGGKANDSGPPAGPDSGSSLDASMDAILGDVTPPQDAGVADTGSPDGPAPTCNGSGCSPADVSAFQPVWKPPTAAHQNKCSPAFIDGFYQDCLGANATQASCSIWYGQNADQAHQACAECIVTPETYPKIGPIYSFDNTEDLNFAGCLALMDPSEIGCAQDIQAAHQCSEAACMQRCPIKDGQTWQDYQNCAQLAETTCGCQSWAKKAECENNVGDAGAGCFAGNSWHESYSIIVPVFCGP
jgi:hypothetical protein